MDIREFAFNLQKLYEEMSVTFSEYQKSTGLHCLSSCGRCYTNPDVEASMLEMLPLALKFYDQGTLDEWIDKLEGMENTPCLIYEATSSDRSLGKCGHYEGRPTVCRMFGVAGYFDKHHEATLSICKFIKEANVEAAANTKADSLTPIIADWSGKMQALDPQVLQEKMPLNLALKKACEKIALYAQYQEL